MPSPPTEKMDLRAFRPKKLRSWHIEESEAPGGFKVALFIHGNPYRDFVHPDITEAYKGLLRGICPTVMRAVTIARLMGGDI